MSTSSVGTLLRERKPSPLSRNGTLESHFNSGPGQESTKLASYLHGTISREEAEQLLKLTSKEDGTFLVRVRAIDDEQYRIRVQPDGTVRFLTKSLKSSKPRKRSSLGKMSLSPAMTPATSRTQSSTSLMSVLTDADAQAFTSMSLKDNVTVHSDGPGERSLFADNFQLGPKDTLQRTAHGFVRSETGPDSTAWMGTTSMQSRRGTMQSVSASFQLKDAEGYEAPNQYILSVMYKGAATHHLIARQDASETFNLNKKPTRCTRLDDVIDSLKHASDTWPVPLKTPVSGIEDPCELQLEGKTFMSQGRPNYALHCYKKSIDTLERLMELFPKRETEYEHDLAVVYDLRASFHLARANYSEGVEDCRRASALQPEWWKPHFNCGMLYRAAKRYDDAIREFNSANSLLPAGDPRCDQCVRAATDTDLERKTEQQELSVLGLKEIAVARESFGSIQPRKASEFSFSDVLSDEAIWYVMKKQEICKKNKPVSSVEASRQQLEGRVSAEPDDVYELADVEQTLETLQPKAPSLIELHKEHAQLQKLFEQHLIPHGRWRLSQAQHIRSWGNFFSARLGQRFDEYQVDSTNVSTSNLYSWVLTVQDILLSQVWPGGQVPQKLCVHIIARKPINGFTTVELCALFPQVTSIEVLQVIPSDRWSAETICDNVLPAGDDTVPQKLKFISCTGNYSELLEADLDFVSTPDLVMFCDSSKQSDSAIQADFEDAIHHLQKAFVPMVFTQRFESRHHEVNTWLKQLMIKAAPSMYLTICRLCLNGVVNCCIVKCAGDDCFIGGTCHLNSQQNSFCV
eukprot:m.259240 g.259240  ORF g.259240 m.259240 type:complete len:801 (-) comp15551_c0_seq8:68-2470(-)